jgi:conjugal transfer pilus assembly protein TraK
MSAVLAIACVASMTALPAQALQLVEASDGAAVEAILSIREPTRIRIEGASITDVFGNIHSSQCGLPAALPASPSMTPAGTGSSPINPAGEIALTCDRDKGEIYVRPVGDSAKPINLFVASANATYTLLLRRSDTPADTIVIRDRTPKALKHAPSAPAGPVTQPGTSHEGAVGGDGFRSGTAGYPGRRDPRHAPVMERGTVFPGAPVRGARSGRREIPAAEHQRCPHGAGRTGIRPRTGSVVGIAVEHHNLRPGESTSVYVIRRGETP